jgi:hypothetical protein
VRYTPGQVENLWVVGFRRHNSAAAAPEGLSLISPHDKHALIPFS